MPAATERRSDSRFQPYLHLWIVAALAVQAPLFDQLRRAAPFFVAYRIDYREILLGTLAVTLLFPIPLALLRRVLSRWQRPARILDGLVLGTGALLFCAQALRPVTGSLNGLATMVAAGLVGLLIALVVSRYDKARLFVSFLAPAIVVIPWVFLSTPRILALRSATETGSPGPMDVASQGTPAENLRPTPIVFVMFDALSSSALTTEELEPNPFRYPNITALARESIWFPNVQAVADHTVLSIPGILSGNVPDTEKPPTLATYPRNLFTILAGTQRIVALETVTDLCPPEANDLDLSVSDRRTGLRSLASDLGLIFLHQTLPTGMSRRLPRIDEGWTGFGSGTGFGPATQFRQFLQQLDSRSEPSLHYVHILLPHKPYFFLPTGKQLWTSPDPFPVLGVARSSELTARDTERVLYVRYLLQAGLVDKLVGDLVDRLRQLGTYERSLIVVTSDHGGRNQPAGLERDLFSVPLLIKLPFATRGEVQSKVVSTLDLLPTLLDLLSKGDSHSDPRSFFSPEYQPTDVVYTLAGPLPATPEIWRARDGLIQWTTQHLGTGEDPESIFAAGSERPDLVGRQIDAESQQPATSFFAKFDPGYGPDLTFDPDSNRSPSLIRGSLHRLDTRQADGSLPLVAVSVNGTIRGVVHAWEYRPPLWYRFMFLIPERYFRPGENSLQLWLLEPATPEALLGPL